jgi:hypothetical protein
MMYRSIKLDIAVLLTALLWLILSITLLLRDPTLLSACSVGCGGLCIILLVGWIMRPLEQQLTPVEQMPIAIDKTPRSTVPDKTPRSQVYLNTPRS